VKYGLLGYPTEMLMLGRRQWEESAACGFLMLRQVFPPGVVGAASRAIDGLIELRLQAGRA
jgi:hypothetical protein